MIFDALRGLSAVLIVFSHTIFRDAIDFDGSYSLKEWLLVCASHLPRISVPGFVVACGFFLTRAELKTDSGPPLKLLVRRSSNVLFPYILWSTLAYLVVIFGPSYFSEAIGADRTTSVGQYLGNLALGQVYGHYFLYVIFQLYVLSFLGLGRRGNPSFAVCVLALFLQIYFSSGTYPGNAASPWRFKILCFGWIFYFVYGRWLGANFNTVTTAARKYKMWVTFSVVVLFVLGVWEYLAIQEQGRSTSLGTSYFWTSVYNIVFITWFLTLAPLRGRPLALFARLGRYSYAIYLLHVPYIFYFGNRFATVNRWGFNTLKAVLILGFGAILIPVLVRMASRRVLPLKVDRFIFGR